MILLEANITSLVIIGIVVMLFLFSSFLVAFVSSQRKKLQHQKDIQAIREQQQNQLIEAAVRSEETERHRIAEALHDEVGAILSSTKLHFQGIKSNSMDERDKQLYEKGKELLDEGIKKVRGISHNLHSNILKEFGLNEAIQHFINMITHGTLVKATTELDNSYTTQNAENDISIFRMVQELVNNILKHSGATELHLQTLYHNDNLRIRIVHNGVGLTQEQFEALRYKKDGLGLKNIQNRIILLKGRIVFSAEGTEYQTILDVPVNAKPDEKD
ncbi:MAG TPA: ATP-binding protein [Flavisolibacter sp.]|nr:ATP-binding protein [Flavisolibacter sp.]